MNALAFFSDLITITRFNDRYDPGRRWSYSSQGKRWKNIPAFFLTIGAQLHTARSATTRHNQNRITISEELAKAENFTNTGKCNAKRQSVRNAITELAWALSRTHTFFVQVAQLNNQSIAFPLCHSSRRLILPLLHLLLCSIHYQVLFPLVQLNNSFVLMIPIFLIINFITEDSLTGLQTWRIGQGGESSEQGCKTPSHKTKTNLTTCTNIVWVLGKGETNSDLVRVAQNREYSRIFRSTPVDSYQTDTRASCPHKRSYW